MAKWKEDDDSPKYSIRYDSGGEINTFYCSSVTELKKSLVHLIDRGESIEHVGMTKSYTLASPIKLWSPIKL